MRVDMPPIITASQVLDRHWNNSMPVNPIAIANSLGVKVYKMKPDDIAGEFLFVKGVPSIIYRLSGNMARDRFTIAHELGHFCLAHGPRHRDIEGNLYQTSHDPIERAANKFAAQLLMPEKVVEFAVKISELSTVREMADYFQVSYQAMRIRLQQLGYI